MGNSMKRGTKLKYINMFFFHCKLIGLTQTVLHVLGKKHVYTTCKFVFMIFLVNASNKVKFFNFESNDQVHYAD